MMTPAMGPSQKPSLASTEYQLWYLSRLFDFRITNSALIGGIRSASAKPRADNRCLTASANVERSTLTVPFWTLSVPVSFPLSAETNAVCAARLASVHAWANVSLATILATWLLVVLRMPFEMGPDSPESCVATSGGSWLPSASTARVVSVSTSSRLKISLVILSVTAACTAGSFASGATVSTYLSVSPTTPCAHRATTAGGPIRQPIAMSSTAAVLLTQPEPRRRVGRATSARSRSSSARSSTLRGALRASDMQPSCYRPAPECLTHCGRQAAAVRAVHRPHALVDRGGVSSTGDEAKITFCEA